MLFAICWQYFCIWHGRKRHNHSTFPPSILSHNVPFYTLFHKTNYFGKTAFLARTGDKVKVSDHSIFAYMQSDMEFVQNFTPPDFQAKNFTLSISPIFNSFSKKKHKTLVKIVIISNVEHLKFNLTSYR